jgi:glycosyltransferase involved in cell wall biosynthesis
MASVSVIVAVFNRAATLQSCLDSIFEQTAQPLEIIVCDGGSSDGSREILEANSARLTYWQSQPDRGVTDDAAGSPVVINQDRLAGDVVDGGIAHGIEQCRNRVALGKSIVRPQEADPFARRARERHVPRMGLGCT